MITHIIAISISRRLRGQDAAPIVIALHTDGDLAAAKLRATQSVLGQVELLSGTIPTRGDVSWDEFTIVAGAEQLASQLTGVWVDDEEECYWIKISIMQLAG